MVAIRVEAARDDGSKLVTTTITEDKRLAAVILAIDHDTAIVPRGALRATPTGSVEASRTFEGLAHRLHSDVRRELIALAGLGENDAKKLQFYLHARAAANLAKKPLIERVWC